MPGLITFTANAYVRYLDAESKLEVLHVVIHTDKPSYDFEDVDIEEIMDELSDMVALEPFYKAILPDTYIVCQAAGTLEYTSYTTHEGEQDGHTDIDILWHNFTVLSPREAGVVEERLRDYDEDDLDTDRV
jgi:hypothetical protein